MPFLDQKSSMFKTVSSLDSFAATDQRLHHSFDTSRLRLVAINMHFSVATATGLLHALASLGFVNGAPSSMKDRYVPITVSWLHRCLVTDALLAVARPKPSVSSWTLVMPTRKSIENPISLLADIEA